jgi:hypothetical protein
MGPIKRISAVMGFWESSYFFEGSAIHEFERDDTPAKLSKDFNLDTGRLQPTDIVKRAPRIQINFFVFMPSSLRLSVEPSADYRVNVISRCKLNIKLQLPDFKELLPETPFRVIIA